MRGAIDFLKYVYDTFGFTYKLKLATRPEKFLGDIEVWNTAEKGLEETLNELGLPWVLEPGDGAFYGPKIDITLSDALRRNHQWFCFHNLMLGTELSKISFDQAIRFHSATPPSKPQGEAGAHTISSLRLHPIQRGGPWKSLHMTPNVLQRWNCRVYYIFGTPALGGRGVGRDSW